MSPPKKRQRVVAAASAVDAVSASGGGGSAATAAAGGTAAGYKQQQQQLPTMDDLDGLFGSGGTTVDTADNNSGSNNTQQKKLLLQLATWQQQLYEKIRKQNVQIEQLRHTQSKKISDKQAELYERQHLEKSIMTLKQKSYPSLERLTQEEMTTTSTTTTTTTTMTEEDNNKKEREAATNTNDDDNNFDIMTSFFQKDVRDPNNKQEIVQMLQLCLKQRAALQKDVNAKKKQLELCQIRLKEKQEFLKQLPNQLNSLDRSMQNIAKFMLAVSNNQSSSTTTTTNYERIQRLEQAQQLPSPLYSLYRLLQNQLDYNNNNNNNATVTEEGDDDEEQQEEDNDTMSTTTTYGKARLSITSNNKKVILQLPVTEVNGGASTKKTKRVSLHFSYLPQPVGPIVTVYATGCGSTLNQDVLLDQLFPGDIDIMDNVIPSSSSSYSDSSTNNQKAYQWCNHLAGIYPVPPIQQQPKPSSEQQQQQRRTSTRVVLQQLDRRIRANAALKYILNNLQRGQVLTPPPVPATSDMSSASHYSVDWKPICKLANFIREDSKNPLTMTTAAAAAAGDDYLVTYRVKWTKAPRSLQAWVQIHPSRYPAVPPVWSFYESSSNSKAASGSVPQQQQQPPLLYDQRLAQLEHQVNVEALQRVLIDSTTHQKVHANNEGGKSTETSKDVIQVLPPEEKANLQYFEWILVHQIREIMMEWDNWGHEEVGRKRRGRAR